ncbi:hypothetical protein, partial [Lysinibacillus sp. F5]|uniref:hypothetical protein n=2 Tax=Lysinibacillus TaxID=400634 RepID=UPI000B23BCA9
GEPLNGAVAEEAARRSPTGKQVAYNRNPFLPFTKMLLWMVFFSTLRDCIKITFDTVSFGFCSVY